jgi:NAD(P)-dependent dehydrogenase (short-subunit alcohol dehydrogenase family)
MIRSTLDFERLSATRAAWIEDFTIVFEIEKKMASVTPGVTLSELMKHGNTAVVTGASSGIGKCACLKFAAAGMNVWMIDVDAKELAASQKVAKAAAAHDDQLVLAEIVDVADASAMESLAQQVFEATGKCHILINNAGIGLGGNSMTDMSTVEKVVNVNTYGPIHGCLAFVPRMQELGEPGIIINTGSKQGITMPPGNLTYNMSKAALKCYTEGLEHELMMARAAGTGQLRAALLVPGWVNTSIALKSGRAKAAAKGETYDDAQAFFHEEKPHADAWMPSQVVDFMQQELDKGRFYIICPDNDVDRTTDNLRMTWTMQDITENRPPLSRWHPDYKDKFTAFLEQSKSK